MNNHPQRTRPGMLTVFAISSITLATPLNAQVINEDHKIMASDGAMDDWFSFSIAIDNAIVAVGSVWDDDNGEDSGSAFLFDANTGDQLFKLLPNDGESFDNFGRSIAISNGIVAIGSPLDDVLGTDSGSVYLFDASTGNQLHKLSPGDGWTFDWFGASVAIENAIVAVGSLIDDDHGSGSGSVYLFDANTGDQLFKLLPDDGTSWDRFGQSIAIDNAIVAIGANGNDDNGDESGSAYLFDANTGNELFKLLPSDGAMDDNFGISIAISNSIVVVGAWLNDENGTDSGAAYLFDASTGNQLHKLLASDGDAGDQFGFSVDINNGIVAIGASGENNNGDASGSTYLFDAKTGEQIAILRPTDAAEGDQFGISVAINNDLIAVGAFHDDDNGTDAGSAYIFSVQQQADCPADITGDGQLNFFDVSAFLSAFANNDPIADFTDDGDYNFFDVSAFLTAFAAGCP